MPRPGGFRSAGRHLGRPWQGEDGKEHTDFTARDQAGPRELDRLVRLELTSSALFPYAFTWQCSRETWGSFRRVSVFSPRPIRSSNPAKETPVNGSGG